jgi:oxepin-CoA hydrolase / 3-oxo-5,6-dehydrosuberyl-CoA semialdehyde dehydrogenase
MTHLLQSNCQGRWQDGTGEQRPLRDAATGEIVAVIPSRGPDIGAMLGYARDTGGPALRELTFSQRAGILKAVARHLSAHLDELADGDVEPLSNGRLLVLNCDDGAESTGHGVASPIPEET